MNFVETHCHLDDDAFGSDLLLVLERARTAGVERFVNIGYEPASWDRSVDLNRRFPEVAYTLGMHPNSAERWTNDTADRLQWLLASSKPVAIGEIGLDFYRETAGPEVQRQAFRDQLDLAATFNLPVVIHMRGPVEAEIMEHLSAYSEVRAIFHSFDGSARLRDFALNRGDLLGVGGLMTRAGSVELRQTLRAVSLDSIVLETDSPYLTPRGCKNRRNTPAAIPVIAAALAELLETDLAELAQRTTANALRVFRLEPVLLTGGAP